MNPFMLSFLTISFLVLDVRSSIWNKEPQDFVKGNTYEYQYSSQILTGLPKTSSDKIGLQINSIVELFFETQSRVIMTLKSTEILEPITNIRTQNSETFIDKRFFKRFTDINDNTIKTLSYPVRFSWNLEKKIQDMVIVSKDEFLSLNIKRGIINLLNMKLQINMGDWDNYGGSYVVDDDEGIDGICTGHYIWLPYPYKTPASKYKNVRSLSLTRTKSSNRCKEPRGYDVTNFVAASKGIDLNRTLVKNENFASMNLSLWKSKKFFVWEAQSKSTYTIEESIDQKESISTIVIQSLKYVKVTKKVLRRTNEPTKSMSLMMGWHEPNNAWPNYHKKRILELISKLGNTETNALPDLIKFLRRAEHRHLKDITTTVSNDSPSLMKLYLKVLSEVLTPHSLKIIIDDFILKPQPGINDDNEMASLISPMAGLGGVIDVKLIHLLMTTVTNKVLLIHLHRSNTYKTSIMTLGSLIGKYYSQNPKYDIKKAIKFFTTLVMDQRSSISQEEKTMVVLKSLGNIGAMECFPNLEKLIISKRTPLEHRVQAIHSMRKLVRRDMKIELMLLAIFTDVNEDIELRIATGVDIILRSTRQSTLDSLVTYLNNEPMKQVRAFMQDFVVNLSQLPELRDKLAPILKRIKIINYSDEYSKVYSIPVSSGVAWISVIYTRDSSLPRSGSIVVIDNKFGKVFKPIEIGFRLENSKINKLQSIDDLLKLPLKVYYKKYDNDLGYWLLDSRTLNTIGFTSLDDFKLFLRGDKVLNLRYYFMSIVAGEMVLPTTSGLIYSARLHNIINIQLNISCSQKYHDKKSKSNKLKISINPSVMMESIFEVGIDALYVTSGVISILHIKTPDPTTINVFINEKSRSFSIGLVKPPREVHIFSLLLEKMFKITYKTDRSLDIQKFVDIAPFDDKKSKAIQMETEYYPFLFNRHLKVVYNNGLWNSLSRITAGSRSLNVWIFKKDSSHLKKLKDGFNKLFSTKSSKKFDEATLEIVKHSTTTMQEYSLSLNYFKDAKMIFSVALVNVRLSNQIDITYPETIDFVEDVIQLHHKKRNMKFAKLSGSFQQPLLLIFNKNEPFKFLTFKKEYSTNFIGGIKNSMGNQILNMAIQIGMNPKLKNTDRYKEHDAVYLRCINDFKWKRSNSPACFHTWLTLNNYNQVTVVLTWNREGSPLVSEMYNKLHQHVALSRFLISKKINVSSTTNKFKLTYSSSPYSEPSSIVTSMVSALTTSYGTSVYPRINMADKIIEQFQPSSVGNREYKICQIMSGQGHVSMVKTFDDVFYNSKPLRRVYKDNDAERIVLVQDENQMLQISELRTSSKVIIQIISKGHPLVRLVRKGNKVYMEIDNQITNKGVIVMKNNTFVTMSRLQNSIYDQKSIYELNLPVLKIRLFTDLESTIVIEASKDYRSILRGVCGDMDLEVLNEFKNADCTGIYRSPEDIFQKSDYQSVFKNYKGNSAITQFISMKQCSKSLLISLI